MSNKMNLMRKIMLTGGLLLSICVFPCSIQSAEQAVQPLLKADFQKGLPEVSVSPGDKRLGRGGSTRISRKHPYEARHSHPNVRNSLREYAHTNGKEKGELVLGEDMLVDVLGAMNYSSGTFAVWLRPGDLFSTKKGGQLFSVRDYEVWAARGPFLWSLEIRFDEKGKGELVLISGNWRELVCKAPMPEVQSGKWVHLAAVWDENHGAKLYWNGELIGSSWMEGGHDMDGKLSRLSRLMFSRQPMRLQLHADPQARITDLQIYDVALNAEGVKRLVSGEPLTNGAREKVVLNRNKRLAALGWNESSTQQYIVIPSGKEVTIREAAVLDARENLRAAGWRAVDGFPFSRFPWWYHGYRQDVTQTLKLKLDPEVSPDFVTGIGNFSGQIANHEGEVSAQLSGGSAWFGLPLEKGSIEENVAVIQESGELNEIHFYEITVAEGNSQATQPKGIVPVRNSDFGAYLSDWAKRDLQGSYSKRERSLWVESDSKEAAGVVTVPALTYWHLTTRPQDQDFYLGAIALRLKGKGDGAPIKARVVVHDALSPFRELARLNLLLQPDQQANGQQDFAVRMEIRDTMVPKGSAVWLTLILEKEFELDTASSGMQLISAADENRALELWKAWELRTVREMFESLSEPRPWGSVGDDFEESWWLRVGMVEYEQLEWGLRRILERFPEDPLALILYHYTHPLAPNPAADLPLPESGPHPEWAVLARECLAMYKHFVDWWIDERQHANGEFGHFYGDDTDLVQDWPDLALIVDANRKYADSLAKLAEGVGFTYLQKGEPVIANGLNVRWTDSLHAYEEGLNIQPWDFLLSSGSPRKFQQLLNTVSRYDGFLLTKEQDGMRSVVGTEQTEKLLYLNTARSPVGGVFDRWGYLFMHAGLAVSWYNQDPEVWQILEELGRWSLTRQDQSWRSIGATLLSALYSRDGDLRWLQPLVDPALLASEGVQAYASDPKIYPTTLLRIEGIDRQKAFEQNHVPAEERYAELRTTEIGGSDLRFQQNWLDWKFTGDKRHLTEALGALYKRLKFTMPALTEAGQSGDRVAIPKQLLSLMYTGGIPSSRNKYFYPDFAISYEGFDDRFAALVLDNTKTSLDLLIYSFDPQVKTGRIVTWELDAGEYEITQGPDRDGDDQADEIVLRERVNLRRWEGFNVTVPPAVSWVVNVRQIRADEQYRLPLGDAALEAGEISLTNNRLSVPIYNLGAIPLENVRVRLRSNDGRVVLENKIPVLPGIKDWQLGSAEVQFDLTGKTLQGAWILEVDPESQLREITTRNNRLQFSFE